MCVRAKRALLIMIAENNKGKKKTVNLESVIWGQMLLHAIR